MSETAIDAAYLAHMAEPESREAHLRFLERVVDAELYLLLETEAEGERITPQVFELDEGRFVLAFDRDERMAAFLDEPAPYAAVAGRRLVQMLAGEGLGIGLNLGVAPSSTLLPAAAINWVAEMSAEAPQERQALPSGVRAPTGLTATLLAGLDAKLAAMADRIGAAHIVEAVFDGDDAALLLVLVNVPEAAQRQVADAVAEAVQFSGADDARLDVTFVNSGTPILARIEAASVRIELPVPERAVVEEIIGPGMNPDQPPRLK